MSTAKKVIPSIGVLLAQQLSPENQRLVDNPILRLLVMKHLSHCVILYLIPFEEDASYFLIFWSTHMYQIGERKKIEILRWPSEIAC